MQWPSTPLVGYLDENAGYAFGNNQLMGGLQIIQKRYGTRKCSTEHASYPVCVNKLTEHTEPIVMRRYQDYRMGNTTANLIQMHKSESPGSKVCIPRKQDELYNYDQLGASRNDVVYSFLKLTQNIEANFDPVARAR